MFIEIVIDGSEFRAAGFDARDALEDPLEEALERAALGAVTGGGSGGGSLNIDVEVSGDPEAAVALIREVLRRIGAPPGTQLRCGPPLDRIQTLGTDRSTRGAWLWLLLALGLMVVVALSWPHCGGMPR